MLWATEAHQPQTIKCDLTVTRKLNDQQTEKRVHVKPSDGGKAPPHDGRPTAKLSSCRTGGGSDVTEEEEPNR